MQENTNWYQKQQPPHHHIMVTTRKILHPRLDDVEITDVQEIPTYVCNRIQEKKDIQRHPIYLTYYDYDYILDEIKQPEKLSLK